MNVKIIWQLIYQTIMFCHSFYDLSIQCFIDEFIETNLKLKNKEKFIMDCIYDLNEYTYSENDNRIIDKYNLVRYMTSHYSPEEIFQHMDGKKAAEVIRELNEIEFIEEMIYYPINLEELLCLYYIGYIHHNKNNIIKYLLKWI